MKDLPGDAVTIRLIEALVGARILLADSRSESGSEAEATLRIAHERVLESWELASRIIAREKEFFQTRSNVTDQYRLGGLIRSSVSLDAAVRLKKRYGAELPPELRSFIDRSVRRARVWRVVYGSVAVVLGGLVVVAGWLGYRSQQNYEVARTQVDSLIQQIASQLENTYGLRTDAITAILSVVQGSIEQLAENNPDPVLEKSRGDMLYRFAKIYRKTGQNDQQGGQKSLAETYATASFDIRKTLAEKSPDDDHLQGDLGDSYELMGDIRRDQVFVIRDDNDRAKLKLARTEQETAFAIRQTLWQRDPPNRRWRFGLSYSQVRLGDLDHAFTSGRDFAETRPELEASLEKYLEAQEVADLMSLDFTGDAEVRKEVAFTSQKVGDGYGRLERWEPARAAYEKSACIRTELFNRETENAKVKDDLAFILGKISAIPELDNEYAQALAFRSLATRRLLYESDLSNANWTLYLADGLSAVARIKVETETLAAFWFLFESRDKLAFLHKRYPSERRFERRLNDVEASLQKARDMLRQQGVVFNESRDPIYEQIAGEEAKYRELFDSKYAQLFAGTCEPGSSLPAVAGSTP